MYSSTQMVSVRKVPPPLPVTDAESCAYVLAQGRRDHTEECRWDRHYAVVNYYKTKRRLRSNS